MVGPDPKIQSYRDDEVQPTEDRYLRKEKTPTRNFGEVAAQVDEKRYLEEEQKKLEKKEKGKKTAPAVKREEINDKVPTSIFDLAKHTKKNSDKDDDEQPHQQVVTMDEDESSKKKSSSSGDSSHSKNTEFIPEQHDLSYVNPLASAAPISAINLNNNPIKAEMPIAPVQNIQEIIDRIAKEVSSLEMNGKSETIVTLKGPLFDQSRLILSGFDSARGQFNITIDNLTQAGKNLLDLNQNALMENLSKKGYMIHIVTTTTTLETTKTDQLAQDNKFNNPNQEKEQEKDKEKRNK